MEVKYLGLILDMQLTWKAQSENMIRLIGLCGPVTVHLVKPGAKNLRVIVDLHHGNHIHFPLWLHGMATKGLI